MPHPILPYQEIFKLCNDGNIQLPQPFERYLQPASFDIPITLEVYEISASFIPYGIASIREYLFSHPELKRERQYDNNGGITLCDGSMYIIYLGVHLDLPDWCAGEVQTRSTAGRSDLLVSVVQEHYAQGFNHISPGYTGGLWAIVQPQSYPVRFHSGDCLCQARMVIATRDTIPAIDYLSLNLAPDPHTGFSLYRSLSHYVPLIFNRIAYVKADEYWSGIRHPDGDTPFLLEPGYLYIARSIEAVIVHPDEAMDLVAYTPSIGELKTHYAGYFDPGFGLDDHTNAIFEIRVSHPVLVRHGQRIAEMAYFTLTAATTKPYKGVYQGQHLRLGKQFIQ